MPSNRLSLPCLLLLLPSIFPSIRVFSNKLALCIRWWKYSSFNFSTSPSNEYSALISFRMDWLDLLDVQGSLNMRVYICAYILFHILFHYGLSRILNIVPWLSSRTLLFNHLTCNSLPLVTTQAFKDSLEYIKWFLERISVKSMMIIPHQDLGWMVI